MRKTGFTLIELLIVIAILAVLSIILIGLINPSALVEKANDSRRKSDLNKIKTAFEEYYDDKGYYPSNVSSWNDDDSNCGKVISEIEKYLKVWPCDPNDQHYKIMTNKDWFKVATNLENRQDKDIPAGWYTGSTIYITDFVKDEVNYGVSSTNVLWYEKTISEYCDYDRCFKTTGNESNCNEADDGCVTDLSKNEKCFVYNTMSNSCDDPVCLVPYCGGGSH